MIDNVITDVEKAVTRPCQLIYSFGEKKVPWCMTHHVSTEAFMLIGSRCGGCMWNVCYVTHADWAMGPFKPKDGKLC